ncbi:hypothetical protein [Pseudobacteriovorax antillogorgiicola]|uniref:Uncharacterized protein n=1 Tax=Pseudobacteriovorax antillogorgiicola TaxID=1513793 RepID=A0A1Y6C0M8_9BACT|nr:hypothetical protein [Pseudobacteriovorax antillogorgiicola]TCS52312.1 hypothetical protein EDD56_10956 [Pseudobacteriovorax antillogorgiicola]SMF30206.1 hypothetical protein SAMN06296036_109157 [Pseudobacteriovorax antillogorgiicola]
MKKIVFAIAMSFVTTTYGQSKDDRVNVMICENGSCRVEQMSPIDGDLRAAKLIEETMVRSLKLEGLRCEHHTTQKKNYVQYKLECFEALERTERYVILVPDTNQASRKLGRLFKKSLISKLSHLVKMHDDGEKKI